MISVRHEHDDHFHIDIRHHGLVVDQPRTDGSDDLGPTPTELFVASLASCSAFYTRRFLARHGIPTNGFRVDCDFEMSEERPARVKSILLDVTLPAGFPDERREALRRVIEHCTVTNSLRIAPKITLELNESLKTA